MSNPRPVIGLEFPPWPCVYVIAGGHRVKIGYTTDMGKRLAALQMASPLRLRVLATRPGTQATEVWLHRQFSKYRVHGEWFNLPAGAKALLLRYMSGEEPMPESTVEAIQKRKDANADRRVRRQAAERWNGLAPSTGKPKYSKVKVIRVPPE